MVQTQQAPEAVAAAALTMGTGELIASIKAGELAADAKSAAAWLTGARIGEDIVAAAPGHGGVRFGVTAGDQASPQPDPLFLAEAACAAGIAYACEAPLVHFPAAGMTMAASLPHDKRYRIEAGADGMTVTGQRGEVLRLRQVRASGARWRIDVAEASHDDLGLTVTDEYVGGLRFVKHGSAISGAGGRDVTAETSQLSAREAECVRQAVAVLEAAAPEFLAELTAGPLCVVPLKRRPGIARQSLSHRKLPGLVWSSITSPPEFIDLVCHEYHHLKLFTIDQAYPLLDKPAASVLSPWRSQTRTAEGLLHAIFVFFQLTVLFDRIYQLRAAAPAGLERMATWLVCMDIGLRLLAESDAGLTSYGSALTTTMQSGVTAALPRIAQQVGKVTIDRLRQEVDEHLAQAGDEASTAPRYLF